jgi:hypothetical protein
MKDIGKSSYLREGIVGAAYGRLSIAKGKLGGYASGLSDRIADKVETGLVKAEDGIDYAGRRIKDLDGYDGMQIGAVLGAGIGRYATGGTVGDALLSAMLLATIFNAAKLAGQVHIGGDVTEIIDLETGEVTRPYEELQKLYTRLRGK